MGTGTSSGAPVRGGMGSTDIAPDQTAPYDHQTAGSGHLDNHLTLGQAVGYAPDESIASGRKVAG